MSHSFSSLLLVVLVVVSPDGTAAVTVVAGATGGDDVRVADGVIFEADAGRCTSFAGGGLGIIRPA
jgi:hypothetical protein